MLALFQLLFRERLHYLLILKYFAIITVTDIFQGEIEKIINSNKMKDSK